MATETKWQPGDEVTLKTSTQRLKQVWVVEGIRPGGAVEIYRIGRPKNIFTRMYALPTNLQRAEKD